MQSMVLILILAAVFSFGFFVAREWGRFLDENQTSEDMGYTDECGVEAEIHGKAGEEHL